MGGNRRTPARSLLLSFNFADSKSYAFRLNASLQPTPSFTELTIPAAQLFRDRTSRFFHRELDEGPARSRADRKLLATLRLSG
jgi:hypothetical protein